MEKRPPIVFMMQHHQHCRRSVWVFPGRTLLVSFTSFTTMIPTIPTATMLCFYDDVVLVLLVTVPVALLTAAPVTLIIAVSCC